MSPYTVLSLWTRKQHPHPTMNQVIRDLDTLQDAINITKLDIVGDMRKDGWTWAEIGEALGVTGQAARSKYKAMGVK